MSPQQRVIVGQVYPWDVDDALLERSARLGIGELAIAAHYHAVRAVHRGAGRIRSIQTPESAAFFTPDPGVWAGSAIRPASILLPAGSAVDAAEATRAAGLEPRMWVTITHHDRPEAGPYSVVDAFGTASPNAVCPAWAETREFGRRLVQDLVRQTGTHRLMVESLAGLGFPHLVAHDKAGMAWVDARLARLLSYCFCAACGADATEEGRDPDADRARIRAAAFDPALDVTEVEAALRGRRQRQAALIATEISAPVDNVELDVIACATTDTSAFGSFAPFAEAPEGITCLATEVGTPQGWADVDAWTDGSSAVNVAATVTVLRAHPSISETIDRLRGGAALDVVTLYHWGSAPAEAESLLASLAHAVRAPWPPNPPPEKEEKS